MTLTKNKIIVGATVLIAVFAFLYFFTGVFSDTRISLTLTTNPDLDNGLILHWTFDGEYMDFSQSSAEVRDRSPEANHGNLLGN